MKKLTTCFSMVILLFYANVFAQSPAVSPIDADVTVARTTATFTWTDIGTDNFENRYDFEVYTDAGYTILHEAGQTAIADVTTTISAAMAFNTTYYWQVTNTDLNDDGTYDDSDAPAQFSLTIVMDTPTLDAETTPVALDETLTWSAAAAANVEYEVQVDDGTGYVSVVTGLTVLSYQFQAGELDPNVEYDVKIIASSTLAAPPDDVESNVITFITALTDPVLTALPATAEINSTLNWTASAAADVEYEVQADDGGSFASVVTGLTTTSYKFQPGDLTGNQAYDVKIIASSSLTGVTIVESNEISFTTTNVGLDGITYDYNSGSPSALGSVLVEFTNTVPPFEVYSTTSDVTTGSYQLYVPSGNYDITFSKTGYQTLSYTNTNLFSYYSGTNIYLGAAVVITAPTGVTQTAFDANWESFTGATEYHIYVSTDPACTGSYVAGYDGLDVGNVLTVNVTGLTPGTTYYYRVLAYDIYSYYYSSDVESVSTVAPPPVLVAPAEYATGVSIEPTFEWDASAITSAIEHFQLQVSTDNDFYPVTRIAYENLDITPEEFDMREVSEFLESGTVYYWRVAAVIGSTVGEWSAPWSFTTTAGCYVYIIGPGNGIELGSDEAPLQWNSNAQGGNELYDLFYGTSDPGPGGFAGTTPQETDLTDKTFLLENIPQGTTYYWQVRVKTSAGAICGYSAVASFKSSGELLIPIPAAPVQDLVINTTSPNLYWVSYAYHPDIAYRVCYALTDAVEASTPYQLNDGTEEVTSWTHNKYIQLTNLVPGEQYFWQVQATSDGGTTMSEWSAPESFQIYGSSVASALIPIYPSGGIPIYSTSVLTYWYSVSGSTGLQYVVRYGTDPTMDGGDPTMLATATETNPTSSPYKQLAHLTDGETYYWQVKRVGGAWSEVSSFVVKASAATQSIPIPHSPINGDVVTSLRPTLSYYCLGYSYGFEYEVWYSDSDDESGGELTGVGGTLTKLPETTDLYTYIIDDLTDGIPYYWQVRSINGGVPSDWSEIVSFEVDPTATYLPIVPTPSYPTGGVIVDSKTPDFSVLVSGNYTGLEYLVRYATHNNLNVDGELEANYEETEWSSSMDVAFDNGNDPDLIPGVMYYWQVKSRLAANTPEESDFSTLANFVVDAGASPVMVILGSPVGNVQIGTSAPTFSWILPTQSTSELSFEVEIANNEQMLSATVINANDLSVETQNLQDGEQYFWRVRSKTDAGDYSLYSMPTSFTVNSSITDVEAVEELPTDFRLDQNYPNPFNPSTTIKYSIPNAEHVSIKVYDMLGCDVATLFNGQSQAGIHTVIWNGTDSNGDIVNSGVYFYRIVSGSNVAIKKMLLLK
ncbi:MAG: T9SS type A sorting domain-containing protein [Bacteroidetes bacterium]|nr:T9SS type A sorting domain-containing protein [Bacteroidota bacterium]